MTAHAVASAEGAVLAPPSTGWTSALVNAFLVELRGQLRSAGVFRGDAWGYVVRIVWVLMVSAIAWCGFMSSPSWPARIALALLAGYAGVQASAIAHESGHGAVSRSRGITYLVGHTFMTWLIGVSFSAWVHRHGMHHVHPNSRQDPDVRPGLFSFNELDAQAARGLAGFCTRHQHRILLPLSTLMGFTLKYASWKHVARSPRKHPVDLALLTVHAGFWLAVPAWSIGWHAALVNVVLLTWAEGAYLSLVFMPNHLGGPTFEQAKAWPPALRQIVTARNLPNGMLLSHMCIGLNTHIEHHLFGNLPTTRLREARSITRALCAQHGIPYLECSVRAGFAELQRYNRQMAAIARKAAEARQAGPEISVRAGD